MLTAEERVRVIRETKDRRNAGARASRRRRAAQPEPARRPGLFVVLPGVLSWARPRQQPLRGGRYRTAYPPEYEAGRERWQLAVRAAVFEAEWVRPAVSAPLCVVAKVVAGGRFDLDRVLTAALDALEGGGALVNDCRVWHLYAQRRRPQSDEVPHVDVLLTYARDDP